LLFENTVLFDEIVNDRLLVAVNPTGQGDYEKMERLYGVCDCANRLSVILIDNNIIGLVRIFAPYAYLSYQSLALQVSTKLAQSFYTLMDS
jgi:hypothetical protein